MRRTVAALIVLSALTPLAGCGKPGRPQAPPGTVYPRVYPNPALGPTAPQEKPQPKAGQAPPAGVYIDPSVRATILDSQTRVLPGSNLPNSQTGTGNTPFDQGLGAPTMSPLPPIQTAPPEPQVPQ